YGEVKEKPGKAFMTGRALAILIDKKDSLFLHSDTIKVTFDSAKNIKNLYCYYKVKFFRTDLQGMCDSLHYSGKDSTMMMYKDPVLWNEKNQFSGDSIAMTILNGEVDTIVFYSNALIIMQDDTNKFNQVKGRNMTGYMKNNDLYRIRVTGNSETLYYVREEDKSLIGINKVISSDMLIFLKDREVINITYLELPVGTIYPEKDISPFDLKLKGFKWLPEKRPKTKEEIFLQ
ncbi:MAG: LptA/OstA family protein, partial [Bacteroidota bacterium]